MPKEFICLFDATFFGNVFSAHALMQFANFRAELVSELVESNWWSRIGGVDDSIVFTFDLFLHVLTINLWESNLSWNNALILFTSVVSSLKIRPVTSLSEIGSDEICFRPNFQKQCNFAIFKSLFERKTMCNINMSKRKTSQGLFFKLQLCRLRKQVEK